MKETLICYVAIPGVEKRDAWFPSEIGVRAREEENIIRTTCVRVMLRK